MDDFKQIINQDSITTLELIKKSITTVKQNIREFMPVGFSYAIISLLVFVVVVFMLVFTIMTLDFGLMLVGFVLLFITSMYMSAMLNAAYNQYMIGMYYSVLGYKEKYVEKDKNDYIKKISKLHTYSSLFYSLIYMAAMAVPLITTLYFITNLGQTDTESTAKIVLYSTIITGMFAFSTIVLVFIMFIDAGSKLECLLADNSVLGSMKKAQRLCLKYKKETFKKSSGIVFYYFVFYAIMFIILCILGVFTLDAPHFNTSEVNAFSIIIFLLFFIASMVLIVFSGLVYNVLSAGLYLRFNKQEGNDIIGTKNTIETTSQEVQEVEKAIDNELKVIRIKSED